MKLYEMEGFLRGKCVPGDMLVNETDAQYLVRKFTELHDRIEVTTAALREKTKQCEQLAAENDLLKSAHPQPFGGEMMKALDTFEKYQDEVPEKGMLDAFFILRDCIRVETPATDAFLREVRAQGVEMLAEHLSGLRINVSETSVREFSSQLRQGGAA